MGLALWLLAIRMKDRLLHGCGSQDYLVPRYLLCFVICFRYAHDVHNVPLSFRFISQSSTLHSTGAFIQSISSFPITIVQCNSFEFHIQLRS